MDKNKSFWFIDILVIVIFLSTAAVSIYLFRNDLMRTMEKRDEEPVGLIVIRNNIVQRRFADRVLWERLFVDSPVYSGDLIRAAELSAATIHIAENQLNLNENTLIRIHHSNDGNGPFQVELREGNLSVTTGAGTGIMLNIMGRQVHAAPGTVLNAELSEEGLVVRVSEGAAIFIEDGQSRELTPGMIFAQDIEGTELTVAAAVVTQPQPNARFLKDTPELISVDFIWSRINLYSAGTLRLEIAEDRNFNRNLRIIDDLDSHVQAFFDTGNWHWRLSREDAVLSVGELSVIDASGPDLLSPIKNSTFRYQYEYPQIRFQWSEKPGASQYILEICNTDDFSHSWTRRVAASSFIHQELGSGTWYWRVLPVYSSAFEGSAGFSSTAAFNIEQTFDLQAPLIELPEPAKRFYTVIRGDSLYRIAGYFYGNPLLWVIIFQANNITNPDLIFPGQVIVIPPSE
jgi:nucleoid-associated protein YgaU